MLHDAVTNIAIPVVRPERDFLFSLRAAQAGAAGRGSQGELWRGTDQLLFQEGGREEGRGWGQVCRGM